MNKRVFVTSDTHGMYESLKSCLDQAGFNYDEDTLIHLGDCVDRGPDSKKVIDLLLLMRNLIAIQGNHDEVWLENLKTGRHPFGEGHGAPATKNSYVIEVPRLDENLQETGEMIKAPFYPPSHTKFFENQVLHYTDDEGRFFCHASYDRHYPVEHQHESIFRWDRKLPYEMMSTKDGIKKMADVNGFKRVFIGHTPTINWKKKGRCINKPIYKAQFVNVDTGGCFGDPGKISLIDITDDNAHILYQA